jgi:nucleotide-binding universal stress UspA family protein
MFDRLLVPIAGDALDARALDVSIGLARQLGASLVGIVVEPFASDTPAGEAALRAHARGLLDGFARRAAEAGVAFEGRATQAAHVVDAILAAAEEHRCDMIVMATHARSGIAGMFQHSHTRDVMSRTKLPVLVLQ